MSASNGWSTVREANPCPLCESADWCSVAADGGAVVCGRTDSSTPPAGWNFLRNAEDGRPIFQRERERHGSSSSRRTASRSAPQSESAAAVDWSRELDALLKPADIELDMLAHGLGVMRDALRALGVRRAGVETLRRWRAGGAGWSDRYPSSAWAIPERDSRGRVVGVSRRADDGRKGFAAGARRGLTMPWPLPDGARVLVVEGASDVAACATLGMLAVGRPSNVGGAEDLAVLLRGRDVLVVGERDGPRDDGRWPGREGAVSVAQKLADAWGRPVRWTLPPEGAKDVREWLRSRLEAGIALDDTDALRAAGAELVRMLDGAAELERPAIRWELRAGKYGRHDATVFIGNAREPYHLDRLRVGEPADRDAVAARAWEARPACAEWLTAEAVADALWAAAMKLAAHASDSEGDDDGAVQSERLVRLALDAYDLGISTEGAAFAASKFGARIALDLRGSRDALRARLAAQYRSEHGRPPSSSALADALVVLEGMAADCAPVPLALRTAWHEGAIMLDLADASGRVVRIAADGWTVLDAAPEGVLFRRTRLSAPMPEPVRGGDIAELWTHLSIAEEDRELHLGYLLHGLIPGEPHGILFLLAEQGAGKTTTAERTADLIDPTSAGAAGEPREDRDLAVRAFASWVVVLDNLSGLPAWLSDGLCRIATGTAWVVRRLYSDDDLCVLRLLRVVMLTTIDPGALRGDLADRLVRIELEPIAEENRRTKAELDAAWTVARPRILGALLELLSRVLAARERVTVARLPRMADLGRTLAALDDVRHGGALARMLAQAGDLAADVLESDPIGGAVVALARARGECTCTAAQLLELLAAPDPRPRSWPTTPRGLAGRLTRLAPALRRQGLIIEPPGPSRRRGRLWRLAVAPTGDGRDGRSPPVSVSQEEDPGGGRDKPPSNGNDPAAGVFFEDKSTEREPTVPTVPNRAPEPTLERDLGASPRQEVAVWLEGSRLVSGPVLDSRNGEGIKP